MSKDTWTIIGTLVAIAVALGGIMINQNSQMNTRINDLQDRMTDGFANANQRMTDGFANANQRLDDMNQRMSDGFANMQRQIDSLQTDVRELRSMQFEELKSEPPAN